MNPDHVFTQEELIQDLASFTDSLDDDTKAAIDAEKLASLETIADGIKQLASRIAQLKQTNANNEKIIEDYKAKIANYAALQADRMTADLKNDDEDVDEVQEALDTVKEGE